MAISYANIQVTKVLTLRGNTIQNNRYTGLPGELTVDTEAKTIRIHDGVTPGGNVVQGGGSASSYANANVKVYLTTFDGNIVPSANNVYSLGSVTNQWKDLFVSNSTIYVGGVPLSIDATGNLTVNGTVIPTIDYINAEVANVTVDLSAYALNANVTAANVGLKGYVDQANTIQSSQLTSANLGIIGYVDQANTIQSAQVGAANLAITAANVGMKGYVDSQTYSNINVSTYLASHTDQIIGGNLTIQGNLTVNGNVSYISVNNLVIGDNIINLADLNPADSLDLGFVAHRTPIGEPLQHTGLIRDASANQWRLFSNVVPAPGTTVDFTDAIYDDLQLGNVTSTGNITATYFIGNTQGLVGSITNLTSLNLTVENIGALISSNGVNIGAGGYNNLLVLPTDVLIQNVPLTVAGNIIANETNGLYITANLPIGGTAQIWNFGADGRLTFPGTPRIDTDANNFEVQAAESINLEANAVVSIYTDTSGSAYQWQFGSDGRLAFPGTPVIDTDANNFDVIGAESVSLEANAAVNIYTDTGGSAYQWQFGNDGNLTLPNVASVSINYANGVSILSGLGGGAGNYSNVDVKAFLGTDAGFADGYQRVIEGYYANLILGDTTKLFSFGNSSKSYFGHDGFLGNASINYIRADNGDVRIATNNGAYAWIFDNAGNLTLSGNTFSVNYANGTPVTFSSSSYSNVQVAAYLNTQGYNLYSNVNVANYLTTATITTTGNITAGNLITGGAFYVANITTIGSSGNISGANYITANVILTNGGWGNISQVANIQANAVLVSGNVTATYFLGNGALLTGIVAGSNYSNVQVAAYLNTQGYNLYSNVNVASYLSTATINTTGNITAQNLIGNISITGNVTGTSANVTLQAGAYTSVFDNQGNVRLPTAYVTGNVTANYFIGNGALLTGIAASSTYSNVQVATYLPTYSGVVGASNVFVSGNVTAQYFLGNGALLTGIASSYSNVQVATYLPTYTGNIANVRLSSSGVLTFPDGTQQTTAAFGGGGNYGNANVAAFLPTYTGTTGITAVGTLATLSVTGNTTVGNLVGTEANTRIIANTYVTTFDIYGNVSFPGNVIAPTFVGSGSLLSGVATKITGSWTVPTGNSTQSFTIPDQGAYQLWVIGNIPNGIISYNATATITNSNVPVVGEQYAWVYNGGGTPIDFTSIPNQFVGTGNTIVRSSVAPSATTNRFDFGINNTSGGNVTVTYGYAKIS